MIHSNNFAISAWQIALTVQTGLHVLLAMFLIVTVIQ